MIFIAALAGKSVRPFSMPVTVPHPRGRTCTAARWQRAGYPKQMDFSASTGACSVENQQGVLLSRGVPPALPHRTSAIRRAARSYHAVNRPPRGGWGTGLPYGHRQNPGRAALDRPVGARLAWSHSPEMRHSLAFCLRKSLAYISGRMVVGPLRRRLWPKCLEQIAYACPPATLSVSGALRAEGEPRIGVADVQLP